MLALPLVMALPQAVTEHDNRLLLLVFGLSEGAAEERRDLERGKDLTAHSNGVNCFRGHLWWRGYSLFAGSRRGW